MPADLRQRLRASVPPPVRTLDVDRAWRRGRALRRQRRAVGTAAGIVLAAVVGLAVLTLPGQGIEFGTAEAPRADSMPPLSVFERPRTADDDPPDIPTPVHGVAAEARLAQSTDHADLYLMPDGEDDGVCLLILVAYPATTGGGCAPAPGPGEAVVIYQRATPSDRLLVAGIAGDDIREVRGTDLDGRTVGTAVVDNTFLLLDGPRDAVPLELRGPEQPGSLALDPLPEPTDHAWPLPEAVGDMGTDVSPTAGGDAVVTVRTAQGEQVEVTLPGGGLERIAYRGDRISAYYGLPEIFFAAEGDGVLIGARPGAADPEILIELIAAECPADAPYQPSPGAWVWCADGWVVQVIDPVAGDLPDAVRDLRIAPGR